MKWLSDLFSKKPTPSIQKDEYSYCETFTAGSSTPWHIRKLTDAGKKLGGGADTPSLCDRTVAWDVNCPLQEFDIIKNPKAPNTIPVCKKCKEAYLATREQA
jgi:hypothetical protein